jgi:hypothetical protein
VPLLFGLNIDRLADPANLQRRHIGGIRSIDRSFSPAYVLNLPTSP